MTLGIDEPVHLTAGARLEKEKEFGDVVATVGENDGPASPRRRGLLDISVIRSAPPPGNFAVETGWFETPDRVSASVGVGTLSPIHSSSGFERVETSDEPFHTESLRIIARRWLFWHHVGILQTGVEELVSRNHRSWAPNREIPPLILVPGR